MEQNWFPTGTPEFQGKVECMGGRPSVRAKNSR